jgi:hypothetical protein
MGLDRLIKLLPAVGLIVAGCNLGQEATTYSLDVVNYSPNAYIVQTTWEDGVVSDLGVAPASRIEQSDPSPLVQVVIYQQDCSHQIATVKLVAPQHWILIDQSGTVSTPETMSDFESKGVPYQELPRPSSCP